MQRFSRTPTGLAGALFALLVTVLSTPAFATTIDDGSNPAHEPDLYQIFNTVFSTGYTSSQQLFDERGAPDGHDWIWRVEGDDPRLLQTWRYGDIEHAFGHRATMLAETPMVNNVPYGPAAHDLPIEPLYPDYFLFYIRSGDHVIESLTPSSFHLPAWNDHFVAIDASDLSLPGHEDARYLYMIAFEDLDLGDRDYQDVVALVRDVRPIPEPATMLMLGLGGLGLAGLRRRRSA